MRISTERPVRVCIFGATAPAPDAFASLRTVAELYRLAPAAPGDGPHASTIEAPASDDPLEVLPFAARAFPRETLVLIRADAELPEYAIERLLRALECEGVLGAAALDNLAAARLPLPGGSPADAGDTRIDALCFAYGERRLIEAQLHGAALSAWHGERLAQLGHASPADVYALAAHRLRCVLLDHLYVHARSHVPRTASADTDPRDPPPPSPLAALRERVVAALAGDAGPDRPGLDARPVLLHVLHGWGGGAERWVRDFAQAFDQACHLVLIARGSFEIGRASCRERVYGLV